MRRPWLLPLLVSAVFVLLQAAAGPQPLFPDSYRYARAAEQQLGTSRAEAHRTALEAFCTSRAEEAAEGKRLDPLADPAEPGTARTGVREACLAKWADAPDITTGDARYQAIFSSRPGYPLLVAPFVAAFGVLDGMHVCGVLIALAGSLCVLGLLRSAGLSRYAAVAGQVAFLVSPLGRWSLQALGEGLVTVCSLGALWGGVLLLRSRRLHGVLLLTGSLAVCAVTRYSTTLLLAALLAVAALAAYGVQRRLRHPGTLLLAALAGAGAAAVALSMKALGLPSSGTTLQDTFTHHFRYPEVPDPWARLTRLNVDYWTHWLAGQAAMPLFLVLTAVAVLLLFRYGGGLGWLALAAAATGIAQVAGHPLAQEADRLGVLMWLPAILGLPLAAEVFRSTSKVRTVRVPPSTVELHRANTPPLR